MFPQVCIGKGLLLTKQFCYRYGSKRQWRKSPLATGYRDTESLGYLG